MSETNKTIRRNLSDLADEIARGDKHLAHLIYFCMLLVFTRGYDTYRRRSRARKRRGK